MLRTLQTQAIKRLMKGRATAGDVDMLLWSFLLLHEFDKFRHRGLTSQTSIHSILKQHQFFDGRAQKTHLNLSTHFHVDTSKMCSASACVAL